MSGGAPGRRPLVVANWKMHLNGAEAASYVEELLARLAAGEAVEVWLAPAFVHLREVSARFRDGRLQVAAQNCHGEPRGAYTGEVSAEMVRDAGARAVLVGHSERRSHFGESDAVVAAKLRAALGAGLAPLLCVGETLEERREGKVESVLRQQLEAAIAGLDGADLDDLVVAYEPVWAIGTGETATPADAQDAAFFLRERLAARLGAETGARTRILYGGSVNASNGGAIAAGPDVDGALVGGASLDPVQFAAIVQAIAKARAPLV